MSPIATSAGLSTKFSSIDQVRIGIWNSIQPSSSSSRVILLNIEFESSTRLSSNMNTTVLFLHLWSFQNLIMLAKFMKAVMPSRLLVEKSQGSSVWARRWYECCTKLGCWLASQAKFDYDGPLLRSILFSKGSLNYLSMKRGSTSEKAK